MAKPVTIGTQQFKSKAAAKSFIRSVRDCYPEDGSEVVGFDALFLHDLLALHPEAADKIGSGISHFTVETDPEFNRTRHFVVHRTDGTSTDFSFNACIDGRNERADRLEALRRAVEDQIISFRNSCFGSSAEVSCPIDGSPLSPNSCHVDHEPPNTFLILAERWLSEAQLDLEQIEITPPQDNQVVTNMTSGAQIASWAEFHRSNAKLRVVSQRTNLSTAKIKQG